MENCFTKLNMDITAARGLAPANWLGLWWRLSKYGDSLLLQQPLVNIVSVIDVQNRMITRWQTVKTRVSACRLDGLNQVLCLADRRKRVCGALKQPKRNVSEPAAPSGDRRVRTQSQHRGKARR